MRLEAGVLPYLRGDQFSNGLRLRIAAPEGHVPDRLSILDTLVRGKRVIHVGCCDHPPLIRVKIARDEWLHARLTRAAAACFGVDNSSEGIQIMRDLGYTDVACADITCDTIADLDRQSWDYLLLGELVEHLDHPIGFLRSLRERYVGRVRHVIVTVPNALCLLNADHARRNQEFINTDHRHWFSPFTLAKQMLRAGIEPEFFEFAELFPLSTHWRERLSVREFRRRRLLRKFPALREGLIMVGRL